MAASEHPSPATVIHEEQPLQFERALAEPGALWLEAAELKRLSGWELKPEGFCRRELCVPLASGREAEFVAKRDGDPYLNFTALAEQMGKVWAADLKHRVWYFGTEPAARGSALASLHAPDFELPDLDGRTHRLSDHRGHKVFLLAWASW